MPNQDKIIIKIQPEVDTNPIEQTTNVVRHLKREASDSTKTTATGFAAVRQQITSVRRAVTNLRSLITGFGIIGLISTIISYIIQIRDWINKSKEAAAQLAEEARKAAAAKAVEELTEKYKALKTAITEAQTADKAMNELDSIHLANLRSLADAQSKLAEEQELATLSPDDPEQEKRATAIRERYARTRALTAVSRKKEDIILERQRLTTEAGQQEKAATTIEDSLLGDDAEILKTKQRLARERQRVAYKKTPEKEREKAQSAADELAKRLTSLEKNLAEKEKEIADLRRETQFKRDKAAAMGGAYESLAVEQQYEDLSGTRKASAAATAVIAAQAKREQEQSAIDAQIAAKEAEAATARQSVSHAQSQLATGQHAISSAQGVDQLRAANAAYANQIATLTQIIKEGLDTARRAEAEVQRLRNRQSTSSSGAVNLD